MWTKENRGRYDRNALRYPSDLTDAEWAEVMALTRHAKRGGNKRTVNAREVVNGLMYILSTGRQWRATPQAVSVPTKTLRWRRLLRAGVPEGTEARSASGRSGDRQVVRSR